VVATADYFADRATRTGKGHGVPKERCFSGPTAYQKLLDTDIDIMLTAAPPIFRPVHFAAAIAAGKHVFMEKPVAVDAPGIRAVIAAGEEAEKKGLMVIAGTQRRHQPNYNQHHQEIVEGAWGRLMAGRVAWNMGHIFHNNPMNPSKPEDLCRGGNWQLWIEMSGDHIVEQHVHNIDVANWFIGTHPDSAGGFGFRARRKAGNMYDFFSGDVEYKVDGRSVYVHSMCRQIGGCWNWVGEQFTFEKDKPRDFKLSKPVRFSEIPQVRGGHSQEHVNFLYYLMKGKYLNEARNVAEATGTAIMIRDAAYTGQRMKWAEMYEDPKKNPRIYNKQLRPTAKDFETGDIVYPKDGDAPRAGKPR
jgi:predicted dehydrogenase